MLNHTPGAPATLKHSVPHSMYTAIKRLVHTLIIATAVALAVGLLLMYQKYQAHWIEVQTAQPGTSISRQYAKIVQPAVSNMDRLQIEKLIAIAIEEPEVLSIRVFDAQGRYLAPLPKTDNIVSLTRSQAIAPSTHVESIVDDSGNLIGYINIHIDTEEVLSNPISLRQQLGFIMSAVIVLALIAGIYITRGFYKFRPWIKQLMQSKGL